MKESKAVGSSLHEAETAADVSEKGVEGAEGEAVDERSLDALDAQPATRRRKVSILTLMGVLLAVSVVVVVVCPPLSWKSAKKDESGYHAVASVVGDAALGAMPLKALSYAHVGKAGAVYAFELTHASVIESSSKPVRARISGQIAFGHPTRHGQERALRFELLQVRTHVYDGDREVSLLSDGGMLDGVSLYTALDPVTGIGNMVPDANINPQVGRVLYIVADMLRYVWTPLLDRPVGDGGEWRWRDLAEKGRGRVREAVTSVALSGGGAVLTTRYGLFGDSGKKSGSGEAVVRIADGGMVERARGALSYGAAYQGMSSQEVSFTLERVQGK